MSIQTYTIELKVDCTDEAHEAITQVMKQYARDFLSSAMLLSPGRAPKIMARTTDSFYSTEEIEVLDDTGNLHFKG